MNWITKAGDWVKSIAHISVLLIALGVVWQVLFGVAVPFVGGDIVGNISGLVSQLGSEGLVGLVTGTIAGLATITPASGFVDPKSAFIIGLLAGSICWYFSGLIKQTFNIDDSLDVFAVHGIGGMLGTLLVGFLANESIGGTAGSSQQAQVQIIGIVAVVGLSLVGTYIIVKIVDSLIGLRVSHKDAQDGLDITTHGERGYHL